jgi:chromosome segregation ATPase
MDTVIERRNTRDRARQAALMLLAEAGMAAPGSRQAFRDVVNVRKVRGLLGGGDNAAIAKALRELEGELVATGLTRLAVPGVPDEIAEKLREVWELAIAYQIDDLVALRTKAAAEVVEAREALESERIGRQAIKEELGRLQDQLAHTAAALEATRNALAEEKGRASSLAARIEHLEADLQREQQRIQDTESQALESAKLTEERYKALERRLFDETSRQREEARRDGEAAKHEAEQAVSAAELRTAHLEKDARATSERLAEADSRLADAREQITRLCAQLEGEQRLRERIEKELIDAKADTRVAQEQLSAKIEEATRLLVQLESSQRRHADVDPSSVPSVS